MFITRITRLEWRTLRPLLLALMLGMGAAALSLALIIGAPVARAATLCVKPGGGDGCQATINAALASAGDGDTVRVATGTYTENVLITKTVTLQGGWASDLSVRDLSQYTSTIQPADNTQSVVRIEGRYTDTTAVAPTLDGFLISGGRADLGGNHGGGLMISVSDAVVISNTISDNRAFLLGGGIYVAGGSPHIEGNRIVNNISDGLGQEAYGGGIQLEGARATVLNNVIAYNAVSSTMSYGGGVDISGGTMVFNQNTVISNANPPWVGYYGGGLSIRGAVVTMEEDVFIGNRAYWGGGVHNDGTLTVTDSVIRDNWAVFGGGLDNALDSHFILRSSEIEGNESRFGGGIYNAGVADIKSSAINNNSSKTGGGIHSDWVTSTLRIEDSTLSGNEATEDGSAIWASGHLTLTRSLVLSNTAAEQGGCVRTTATGGSMTIARSVLSGNSASNGGCIYNFSPAADVSNSTIADNVSSRYGGGVYNGYNMTITNSIISGNEALMFSGGGIVNSWNLRLTNVTLAGNRALLGGGIYNYRNVTLTNVTIAQNQAGVGSIDQGYGGGMLNEAGYTVTLINTVLADNEDLTPNLFAPDCYSVPGGMVSLGHNLVGMADGCNWPAVPFDLVGDLNSPMDPQLGPLAWNGGDTQTYALLSSSPAIDAGHAIACPDTDQRGGERPVDGDGDMLAECDIGAYEYEVLLFRINLPVIIK